MRLKKVVLALLLFIAFPALGSAQELMSRGWIVSSHSNDSDAAPDAGLYFSVPQGQSVTVSMQTSFATTPASVTIQLQTSLDASIWTTVVSSTSTAGETITAYNQVTKYVRANVSARSGGSGVTTQLLANYSYGGSYLSGIISNPLLFCDGTVLAPCIAWNSDNDGTGTGFWRPAANTFDLSINGTSTYRWNSVAFSLISDIRWGGTTSSVDTYLSRRSANTPVTNLGAATYNPAAGSSATIGGVLCVNTTSQATTGTVEEVLATCTLPANALSANGKGVRIKVWGTSANNANNKTVNVRFGGIGGTIVGGFLLNVALQHFSADGIGIRTGASAETWHFEVGRGIQSGTATKALMNTTTAVATSGAIDIVVTGTTPTAAGDFTFVGMIVEFFN